MSRRLLKWLTLITGHIDAWGLSLVISALCVIVHGLASSAVAGLVVLVAATSWLAFAFNDYCDAPFDARDERKRARNFFVQVSLPRGALLAGFGMALLGLALGYAAFAVRGLLVFVVALFALWAYSAPPLRLKCRPIADLVMHAAFVQTAPYLVTAFLLGVSLGTLDYMFLLVFVLSSLAAQLEQQGRDYELDRRVETNFTIWIGRARATALMRIASVLFGGVLLTALIARIIPPYLVPFGLIGLPVIAHRFTRRADQPRSQRLVVLSILLALIYLGGVWSALLYHNE
jgi:4-hydroxybenzoate polyprenyltransferase